MIRGKIGANKRMTVLLAFLRFLDESQKNVSEIHANSCVSFLEHIIFFTTDAQWSNLLNLIATHKLDPTSSENIN